MSALYLIGLGALLMLAADADAAARRSVCVLSGCADPGCAVLVPHPCGLD